MTFVLAMLCWVLLSVPAAVVIGRIVEGPAGHAGAPAPDRPRATGGRRSFRS